MLGIIQLVSAFTPGGHFFSGKAVDFGVPYYSILIGMNVTVTLLICGRLAYLSKQVLAALGPENARLYTSVAAVMVESAAPYTISGVIFLALYAQGNLASAAVGQVWAKLTVSG